MLVTLVGPAIGTKMDVIRRQGNAAVHSPSRVAANDAVTVVAELFQIMYWAMDRSEVLVLRSGFVGRARDLAVLERHLARARAGEGGVVLVEGEPGIGKTALGYELAGRAGRAGVTVCWGACWEDEGAPAYWPWLQVLGAAGVPADGLLSPVAENRYASFHRIVQLLHSAAAARGDTGDPR